MRILVLGGDGYCGWPTALYLSRKGHEVAVADNFLRRLWDHELGAMTLTPIAPLPERLRSWTGLTGKTIDSFVGDRKSTRLNSSHRCISYAVFCLKKKKKEHKSY